MKRSLCYFTGLLHFTDVCLYVSTVENVRVASFGVTQALGAMHTLYRTRVPLRSREGFLYI